MRFPPAIISVAGSVHSVFFHDKLSYFFGFYFSRSRVFDTVNFAGERCVYRGIFESKVVFVTLQFFITRFLM